MVPKQHKSKRQSLHQKYKIKKKVTEHNRKLRKEARKNGNVTKKLKKDPGIPNLFPLKEKLLLQAEEAKAKQKLEKQNKLANLVADAQKRAKSFDEKMEQESSTIETSGSMLKDASRKAFYREFKKVVEAADVILEVLDARDPLGCRTRDIEEMIMASGSSKRVVLVLNKIDLAPRENVDQWLKYLRNEFPTVAFKASTQNQRSNLGQAKMVGDSLNSSADTLIKLLKNYCRNLNIKTSITVGVVGYPNVGKSSLINSLKRSRVCNVGSTPGVTTASQTITLDKNIKLLDCPGIVFAKVTNEKDAAQVLLRNCVRVEQLEDPIAPVELLISRCKKEQLMTLYNVPYFSGTSDFLVHLARQRGKLRRHGIPDVENAARAVIQDWNSGRIPYYTVPPQAGVAVTSHLGSAIVSSWSQEFSLPEIVEIEGKETLAHVKAKQEIPGKMMDIKAGEMLNVDMNAEVEMQSDGQESESLMSDIENEIVSEDGEEAGMEMDDNDTLLTSSEPEIRFGPIKSKSSSSASKSSPAPSPTQLDEEEMLLNPQTNKKRARMQKKNKKAERKAMKSLLRGDDDEMMG